MFIRNKRDQADALNQKFESMVAYYNRDIKNGDERMARNMSYAMMGLQQAYIALDIPFQAHHAEWRGEIIGYDSNGKYIKIEED